jgi:membrane protein DedA with SNARE-associated domain
VNEQLLELVATYGIAALFVVLLVSAIGAPLPATLLLLVAGSFTSSGDLELWQVVVSALAGVIAGDQVGYIVGRLGRQRLLTTLAERLHGEEQMTRAESFVSRWGGPAVFLSRWLASPLGPWVNLGSGSMRYSWPRFAAWDVLGEAVWVAIYVTLGVLFADRIEDLAALAGTGGWAVAGAMTAIVLGVVLWQHLRSEDEGPSEVDAPSVERRLAE